MALTVIEAHSESSRRRTSPAVSRPLPPPYSPIFHDSRQSPPPLPPPLSPPPRPLSQPAVSRRRTPPAVSRPGFPPYSPPSGPSLHPPPVPACVPPPSPSPSPHPSQHSRRRFPQIYTPTNPDIKDLRNISKPIPTNSDIKQYDLRNNFTLNPLGTGIIAHGYSPVESDQLNPNPLPEQKEHAENSLSPNRSSELIELPLEGELPDVGVDWSVILEEIPIGYEYLGEHLGKYETHVVASTPVANPLIWAIKTKPSEVLNFKINNPKFEAFLFENLSKIEQKELSSGTKDLQIELTRAEWNEYGINASISTFSFISVFFNEKEYQFSPYSEVSRRISNSTHEQMNKDWKIGLNGEKSPFLLVEECTGLCSNYETKAGKKRFFMNIDIAGLEYDFITGPDFKKWPEKDKLEYILTHIFAYMAHEYTHVFQFQCISPTTLAGYSTEQRFGAEEIYGMGERYPNAISRWITESFATILPYFMGISFPYDKGMKLRVEDAIKNILKDIKDTSLTEQEFSDRLMYRETKYGYVMNERPDWTYLAAAVMASKTSWQYLLAGFFYKDFQRIPSDTEVDFRGQNVLVPNTDKVWLHNFNMTQENFLKHIFTEVKAHRITVKSLTPWLPGGKYWHIPGLKPYETWRKEYYRHRTSPKHSLAPESVSSSSSRRHSPHSHKP